MKVYTLILLLQYSFQTYFFDFTLENVNKLNADLEAFDNYSNQNFGECRIIIFSKNFD